LHEITDILSTRSKHDSAPLCGSG